MTISYLRDKLRRDVLAARAAAGNRPRYLVYTERGDNWEVARLSHTEAGALALAGDLATATGRPVRVVFSQPSRPQVPLATVAP